MTKSNRIPREFGGDGGATNSREGSGGEKNERKSRPERRSDDRNSDRITRRLAKAATVRFGEQSVRYGEQSAKKGRRFTDALLQVMRKSSIYAPPLVTGAGITDAFDEATVEDAEILRKEQAMSSLCARYGVTHKLPHGFSSLATLGEGESFGEQSFISGENAYSSVITLTYTEMVWLHRSDFELVLAEYPSLAMQVDGYKREMFSQYNEDANRRHNRMTRINPSSSGQTRATSAVKNLGVSFAQMLRSSTRSQRQESKVEDEMNLPGVLPARVQPQEPATAEASSSLSTEAHRAHGSRRPKGTASALFTSHAAGDVELAV